MSAGLRFADVLELLHTAGHEAFVLSGSDPHKKVAVCPRLAGRVMASTWEGESGRVHAFIDDSAFHHGIRDTWDNWGGEERYWLCPEGGQFGLMFNGGENSLRNYHVQPGINSQPYEVADCTSKPSSIAMTASFSLINAARTQFQIRCTRRITILEECPYAAGIGDVTAAGFQSESTIQNIGTSAWTRCTGALAHWHLGQFTPGKRTIVIVPYRQGAIADPPIREDYFRDFCLGGRMPADRYHNGHCYALFKADGRCRTKIGQNASRACSLLASVDLERNEMVILQYDLYPELEYASSYWYEQPEPFHGDAISFSAEGPDETGEPPAGRCYELEAMSPAMFLAPRERFTFRTRTMHLSGPRQAVAAICRRSLGVEVSELEAFDRQ